MKKIFLIALVLTGFIAKAQYFHHIYGTTSDDYSTGGVNTTASSAVGMFSSGLTLSCLPFGTIPAAHCNTSGNIPGAPYFSKNFILTTPAGGIIDARGSDPFELATSCPPATLGVIGNYRDFANPGVTGVYYMQILPGGVPGTVFTYVPPTGYTVTETANIGKSLAFAGDVYICGTVVDANNIRRAYALRINECSGALVWGQIYDIPATAISSTQGRDIEENLVGIFGAIHVAMVGEVINNGQRDGFLFHINATTGIPAAAPVLIYGAATSQEALKSIETAAASNFAAGYILGGYTSTSGNNDFLVIRTNATAGVTFFTNRFDYALTPGVNNECYEVMQRLNSACVHEYYAAGNVSPGVFGLSDIMVVKMDQNGNGVALGQFNYGGAGNDFGASLDQLNQVPCTISAGDALSIFGSWGSAPGIGGASDLLHIRAYFNGVGGNGTGCLEKFNNTLQAAGITPTPLVAAVVIASFTASANLSAYSYTMPDLQLCFAPAISNGNNARVAPEEDKTKDKAILVMPNPAETGQKAVTLEIESDGDGEAEIEIYDMQGKQYYKQKHTLTKGANSLPVEIGDKGMATGIYNMRISNANESKTVLLMIK